MIDVLLPRSADDNYRGHKVALWIFAVVVLMKFGISVGTMLNGRNAASSADGIPLDTYSPAAAQTLVSLFATLGLANLIICLVCIVVLVRYRAMVPLMFALLVLQQLSRYLILHFLPIVRAGTPPGAAINLGLLALMIVGLALSLRSKGLL